MQCAQVIFFPSHNAYKDPAVTRRVLDFYDFMNSKVSLAMSAPLCCASPSESQAYPAARRCCSPGCGTTLRCENGCPLWCM